jgi:hypothetical protein
VVNSPNLTAPLRILSQNESDFMSTMLATKNPEAAARIGSEQKPLPGPGDIVVYHMRPGAMRAGQTSVPGFVLATDRDNRQLKLLVIFGQDDMMTEERVPERTGSDYGWTVKPGPDQKIAELRDEVGGLKAVIAEMSDGLEAFKIELAQTLFGDHDKPAVSFVDRIDALDKALKAGKAKK